MSELIWFPQRGYGSFTPTKGFEYDDAYFDKFARISDSPKGVLLNKARAEFVRRTEILLPRLLVDIGSGSGAFMKAWGDLAYGFDVCEKARSLLISQGRFTDPYSCGGSPQFEYVTMWDSIEHVESPVALIQSMMSNRYIFLSTPIYENAEHCLRSKHFKPNEHLWYFTEWGLVKFFAELGYEMLMKSRFEEDFGRTDIGSYCFRRVAP